MAQGLPKSTQVILAYWRNPRDVDTAADVLFMWLCDQTFSQGREELFATRREIADAIGRRLTATTLAIKNILELGVIRRRRKIGKHGFSYWIDQEAVLRLPK